MNRALAPVEDPSQLLTGLTPLVEIEGHLGNLIAIAHYVDNKRASAFRSSSCEIPVAAKEPSSTATRRIPKRIDGSRVISQRHLDLEYSLAGVVGRRPLSPFQRPPLKARVIFAVGSLGIAR
jgi:ACT domain-containing protein